MMLIGRLFNWYWTIVCWKIRKILLDGWMMMECCTQYTSECRFEKVQKDDERERGRTHDSDWVCAAQHNWYARQRNECAQKDADKSERASELEKQKDNYPSVRASMWRRRRRRHTKLLFIRKYINFPVPLILFAFYLLFSFEKWSICVTRIDWCVCVRCECICISLTLCLFLFLFIFLIPWFEQKPNALTHLYSVMHLYRRKQHSGGMEPHRYIL